MDKHFDVVALGEGLVEFHQEAPGQPDYLQGFGGDTSNVVIAAARAGARTAYLTRIGDDSFGRSLLDLWRREGVDTHAVAVDRNAPTGIAFATLEPKALVDRRAGSAASRMTPQWLEGAAAQAIRGARILHVSAISMALSDSACETVMAAMRIARAAGTLVALDPGMRPDLWPLQRAHDAVVKAIVLTDILLPSVANVAPLAGSKDPQTLVDWALAAGAAGVAIRLGRDGVFVSDGQRVESVPGHPAPAADPAATADAFCGSILARLAADDTLFEAARWAQARAPQ
jgi:2-dehydro-3-deoxygluconokinase